MCGIAGLIGSPTDVSRERLTALARAIAHRGPDDEGIEVVAAGEHRIGLVHRRLAIIDPSSAGHQPMHDPTTGNWVTFNGELYNYRELRAEMQAGGVTFRAYSDTEVLLAAYAAWGARCVERFAGMFAFAVWDAPRGELILATDRFGIKPVYWWHDGRRFAFASEVRALRTVGIVPHAVNPQAVASFLAFGSVQAPQTIIAGVQQLLPGHLLRFAARTGTVSLERYWRPPAQDDAPATAHDVVATLEQALRRHLVSDVPVGLFLSGGVDSSALAVLAHRAGVGDALTSFTVTFPGHAEAEGPIARLVGERYCGTHREIAVTDHDLLTALPASLDAQDQPSIDGTNVYVIAEHVRAAGIKTVLSGQGGDEVFGGYPTFRRIPQMLAAQRVSTLVPRAWRAAVGAHGGAHPVRAKIAALLAAEQGVVGCYAVARQLFHPAMRRLLMPHAPWEALSVETVAWFADDLVGRDAYHQTALLEMRGYLCNMLLRDSDVMAMAHGLEVRVPYLDHDLVETVLRVPARASQSSTIPKPLLLHAVRDALPRAVYDRRKMGFTFPWEAWLRGQLRPMVEETLAAFPRDNALGLDPAACIGLWQDFLAHRGGIIWSRAWAPFVLMRWAERQHML